MQIMMGSACRQNGGQTRNIHNILVEKSFGKLKSWDHNIKMLLKMGS
jgi:hypothetical protein